MPKITPNQPFLHGETRYEPGREVDVAPGLASYFVMMGWADTTEESVRRALGGELPQRADVDLEVQDVRQDTSADRAGGKKRGS